jgi:predicted O-linked N-acetylglucosamine transferase (SPINDLY family)
MDHFIRVDKMTDEEAAGVIRDAEIDVLVDLQGLTQGFRPNILSRRPAPIQVTYLGFPGTTGMPCIDYVLADKYVIPENARRFFTEKPLYMPDCFQVNDRKRAIGELSHRDRYDLPAEAFVFCAFNHNHKFTLELFSVWMRILKRTPNSVLWLLADNGSARDNLLRHAEEQGVEGKRLVFAPRVPPEEYLARFQLADLFLDTLPFNGGTTASDALWAGLPLLTCSGRSFASRMAGSLLLAIGLPELITTSLQEYEAKAVALAADREALGELRTRLAANRGSSPLFDTPRFTKALEDMLWELAKPLLDVPA